MTLSHLMGWICTGVLTELLSEQDEGWFLLEAPLKKAPSILVTIKIGLQTYTASVPGLYSQTTMIADFSPDGARLGSFLYVLLLGSLLYTVALVWYFALFWTYFKKGEKLASREKNVQLICAGAFILA
jgi:hypothetical protein